MREGFGLGGGDCVRKTYHKHARADGMHGLAGNGPGFDGYCEVEAKFQQQLEQDVLFAAVTLQIFGRIKKGLG